MRCSTWRPPGQDRHARLNPLGSSGSSLHAKTFAIDGERAFSGSFNFDPRSALLNTERGFVIDCPVLARQIDQAFDTDGATALVHAAAVSQRRH